MGCIEAVSSGETPMALSISCRTVRVTTRSPGFTLTAKAVELKLIDAIDRVGILPIVLDKVNVVGVGQQAGKGRGLGIPQRR